MRAMLIYCLDTCQLIDNTVRTDVQKALALIPPHDEPIDRNAIHDDKFVKIAYDNDEAPEVPRIEIENLPYPGATLKEQKEFDSFLRDAPKEYLEHLGRKAKNLLIRTSLMVCVLISSKIKN